ncbi:hypothetical protein J1N35_010685 [Gossypium stocksii]|uniref:Uncharacterized protein n=1 Tax=Gossypium stocksii TaxID=47602 RepID=A0A9D4AAS3_9ROSI|nr:hypothetical protein J1N35_010685 [Gossypium stocksii]
MGLKEQALSRAGPLYNCTNHPIEVKGSITLLVTLEDRETHNHRVCLVLYDGPLDTINAIFKRLIMRIEGW